MGLQQVGNQNVFAATQTQTPGGPTTLLGNNGAFLSVTRGAAGSYQFVMDPEFRIEPDDIITVEPLGATAARTAHIEASVGPNQQTEFSVHVRDGGANDVDQEISVIIFRTFRG